MMKRVTYILAMVFAIGCGHVRGQKNTTAEQAREAPVYYKECDGVWNDTCEVFHYWVELNEFDYLFEAPSKKQVKAWEKLCEERNSFKPGNKDGVPGGYLNMNQYVTLWDFYEMWFREDSDTLDVDFTLWRLAQYKDMSLLQDSEYNRFYYLKNAIQGLCLFEGGSQLEMNMKAGVDASFQEFYDRVLLREAVRHSPLHIAQTLKNEEKAWGEYSAAVYFGYRKIHGDPKGFNGSAWPMATCGIAEDDARMREESLTDFYFALTDSLDYQIRHPLSVINSYELKKHTEVSQDRVLKEYQRFMDSFEDDEYNYPVSERKKALQKEMDEWKKWMKYRGVVSSQLKGLCKEAYDNSTNNIRRYKLVMLKNRYEGYGITSGEVMECLLPYTASDEELNGQSFDEKWRAQYNY